MVAVYGGASLIQYDHLRAMKYYILPSKETHLEVKVCIFDELLLVSTSTAHVPKVASFVKKEQKKKLILARLNEADQCHAHNAKNSTQVQESTRWLLQQLGLPL